MTTGSVAPDVLKSFQTTNGEKIYYEISREVT